MVKENSFSVPLSSLGNQVVPATGGLTNPIYLCRRAAGFRSQALLREGTSAGPIGRKAHPLPGVAEPSCFLSATRSLLDVDTHGWPGASPLTSRSGPCWLSSDARASTRIHGNGSFEFPAAKCSQPFRAFLIRPTSLRRHRAQSGRQWHTDARTVRPIPDGEPLKKDGRSTESWPSRETLASKGSSGTGGTTSSIPHSAADRCAESSPSRLPARGGFVSSLCSRRDQQRFQR